MSAGPDRLFEDGRFFVLEAGTGKTSENGPGRESITIVQLAVKQRAREGSPWRPIDLRPTRLSDLSERKNQRSTAAH